MANLNYYLGPWVATAGPAGKVWAPPPGTAGAVDLAPLADQAANPAAVTQRRVGFFATAAVLTSEYALLGSGDCRSIPVTAATRSAWKSLAGYNADGDVLADLLYASLTEGSDPDGSAGPLPLVPGTDNWLAVLLPGHSPVRCARFEWGKADSRGRNHYVKLRQLLRGQFQARWAANPALARKCLDYECDKYKLGGADDWKDLVPPGLLKDVPGRLKHNTTITESFTGGGFGGDLTWTQTAGSWANSSGQASFNGSPNITGDARAESDLSSADQTAQVTLVTDGVSSDPALGVCARFSAAARTAYFTQYYRGDAHQYVSKLVAGTVTNLSSSAVSLSPPQPVKCSANGSTIKGYFNGSEVVSVTDTAITGNLRAGLYGYVGSSSAGSVLMDDFVAADIAVGGGGILYTQLERGTRGVVRGAYGGTY